MARTRRQNPPHCRLAVGTEHFWRPFLAVTGGLEIVASAAADEFRFDAEPEVRVGFPGEGSAILRQVTERQNIDSPVLPGITYQRVFAQTRISTRLLDGDGLD